MSLGLFIGSLVVLAIGLLMVAFAYYVANTAAEEYDNLNCGENIFRDYFSGNRVTCNHKIRDTGVALGIIITAGIFIILGLITSIIFGVKLLVIRRKTKKATT